MSARGIASGQWWRRGHSHLDEAEIWLRDLTAADAPAAYRAITTRRRQGSLADVGGGRRVAVLRLRSERRREHLADRDRGQVRRRGTSPRFKDGRVLWPSISARGDTIVFEREFPDLEARHRDGQGGGRADRADRRAGRAVGRAACG